MGCYSYVCRVLIASPVDVSEERDVAEQSILRWNSDHSEHAGVTLLPVRWERDSHSQYGDEPQNLLGKQIVDRSDMLVGIFGTRIGTRTAKSVSGTVQEIEEFIKARKPVMLYFSKKSVAPDRVVSEQYKQVKKYELKLRSKGLIKDFRSDEQFALELGSDLHFHVKARYGWRTGGSVTQDTAHEDSEQPAPPEVRDILSLRAEGHSVSEISQITRWSKQDVQRVILIDGSS